MTDVVLPSGTELIGGLLDKYRADLLEATTATEAAVRQLRQQLTSMERQQIAIAAQKSLLDTLEKDLNPSQQHGKTKPSNPGNH